MNPNAYHEYLRFENFTAFKSAEFEFVPGMNVLVGENGTGKTHALKALYAYQRSVRNDEPARTRFESTFQVRDTGDLIRSNGLPNQVASIKGSFNSLQWSLEIEGVNSSLWGGYSGDRLSIPQCIFIPSVDMIGHTRRFLSASRNEVLDFDSTYLDIVAALLKESPNGPSPIVSSSLDEALNAKLEFEADEERFYLVRDGRRLAMPLVADGLRKIATLKRLIDNRMIEPGGTLFWDEPEVNLNPSLMDEVARALWVLVQNGVQVLLASHSYLILKEIENWRPSGASLRFFGLEPTPSEGVLVRPASTYLEIYPNKIEQQYGELYDRVMIRSIPTS